MEGMPLGVKVVHHGSESQEGDLLLTPLLKSNQCNRGADFLTPTSFKEVIIKFTPPVKEAKEQELKTEDDLAIANRQCEKEYGQSPDGDRDCKEAVVDKYLSVTEGEGTACFPAASRVKTFHKGEVRLADLHVGDIVETCAPEPAEARDDIFKTSSSWTCVVAWLHEDPRPAVPYLRIIHTCGRICVSATHLVRVQQDRHVGSPRKWIPAQDISPGHRLFRSQGQSCIVTEVQPDERQGMYAPLTESGTLLVDGILCSCYAPPPVCAVSHAVCHVAMAPLRAFYEAQRVVEALDVDKNGKPLFTIEVVHPWRYDPTVHPYASVLLRLAQAVASVPTKLLGLDKDVDASDEEFFKHQ